MSKNRVVHFEIGAEDPEKLSEFYKKALGWEINLWPGSDYWMVGKTEDRAEDNLWRHYEALRERKNHQHH